MIEYLIYGFATSVFASVLVSYFSWLIPYNIKRPKVNIELKENTPTFEQKRPEGEKDEQTYLVISFNVKNESKTDKRNQRNAAYNIIAYLELRDKAKNILKVKREDRSVLRGGEITSMDLLLNENTLRHNEIKSYTLYLSFENKYGAKFLSKRIDENIILQPIM